MTNKTRSIKTGLNFRAASFDHEQIDQDARTVALTFSSEHPVERSWGIEILDHNPSSARLGRLKNNGPVLVDHDPRDHVGAVNDVSLGADRRGRAIVRFGKSARAQEIFQDVADGIRTGVSVGYVIHKMQMDSEGSRGASDTYRATDWEPLELSITSIAADPTVGVGREAEFNNHVTLIEDPKMSDDIKPAPSVDVQAVTNAAREGEITRAREILALGNLHNRQDMAQKAVSEGLSLDEFRGNLLLDLSKQKPLPTADIGMSDREAQSFSFVRAINALANPQDRKAQESARFEFEASAAAAQKAGKQARGIMVPYDVMRRDLITGTGTGTAKGGNLVATDLLAGSFIDVLRNKMVLQQLGATFLTGLQGNVAIPKKTTASTSYWVAENVAPTEGALVFGQVTMSPKTLAAYVDFSRRLSIQSSLDVENMVRNDLASGIAVAVDAAALGASPTSGPVGLRGTSGIGSVAIGTNGGAPTWASIVSLIKEVEIDNALTGAAAFLSNPKVKAKMMATPKQSSGVEGNFLLGPPYDQLAGYPVAFSNQVTSTLTKGSATSVCSAMFFGVWSDLLVGQWSGVDLLVDPYTGSSAGTTRVTAFIDLDIAVRYPESFAAVLDYTTT